MAKKKSVVTNAMRILQKNKTAFDVIEYEAEIEENFGEKVAEKTGTPMEQSFKTLVARGEKCGIIVCCIPVCNEVDLKKLAAAANDKKVELVHVKEIQSLTGYIRGGVSPIGMKKKYPTFINDSCRSYDKIAVSGGICGITLMVGTDDLIRETQAAVCEIIRK